jgi:hypothetical protein
MGVRDFDDHVGAPMGKQSAMIVRLHQGRDVNVQGEVR